MKFQAAAINMNIYIGGGLECGGHSREENSKQDMILCEIIKILVNIIPFLRRRKARADECLSSPSFCITLPLLSAIHGAEPYSSLDTHPPPVLGQQFLAVLWSLCRSVSLSHQLRRIFLLILVYFTTLGCKILLDTLVDQKTYFPLLILSTHSHL